MTGWEQRAAEAEAIASEAGSPDVDARLLSLLLDPHDSAVSQAAADALLARADAAGLRLYASAFGQGSEDTRTKLADCLYDDAGERWGLVERLLPGLANNADPQVRQGSELVRQHMAVESAEHQK